MGRLFLGILIIILIVAAGMIFIHRAQSSKAKVDGPIIFFGGSITAGDGVAKPYPVIIGEELKVDYINVGVSTDTTADALKRLDKDVLSKNPRLVVVQFGVNDFLKSESTVETKENLDEILMRISNETEAKILLVTVRVDFVNFTYEKIQKELAAKYDAKIVTNILDGIINNPSLMQDSFRPNQEGHEKIAKKLIKVIKPII